MKRADAFSHWLLVIGPVALLAASVGFLYLTSPVGRIESMATVGPLEILLMRSIVGGIVQICIEVTELVHFVALVERLTVAVFALGVASMFGLEDVIVDGYIVPEIGRIQDCSRRHVEATDPSDLRKSIAKDFVCHQSNSLPAKRKFCAP